MAMNTHMPLSTVMKTDSDSRWKVQGSCQDPKHNKMTRIPHPDSCTPSLHPPLSPNSARDPVRDSSPAPPSTSSSTSTRIPRPSAKRKLFAPAIEPRIAKTQAVQSPSTGSTQSPVGELERLRTAHRTLFQLPPPCNLRLQAGVALQGAEKPPTAESAVARAACWAREVPRLGRAASFDSHALSQAIRPPPNRLSMSVTTVISAPLHTPLRSQGSAPPTAGSNPEISATPSSATTSPSPPQTSFPFTTPVRSSSSISPPTSHDSAQTAETWASRCTPPSHLPPYLPPTHPSLAPSPNPRNTLIPAPPSHRLVQSLNGSTSAVNSRCSNPSALHSLSLLPKPPTTTPETLNPPKPHNPSKSHTIVSSLRPTFIPITHPTTSKPAPHPALKPVQRKPSPAASTRCKAALRPKTAAQFPSRAASGQLPTARAASTSPEDDNVDAFDALFSAETEAEIPSAQLWLTMSDDSIQLSSDCEPSSGFRLSCLAALADTERHIRCWEEAAKDGTAFFPSAAEALLNVTPRKLPRAMQLPAAGKATAAAAITPTKTPVKAAIKTLSPAAKSDDPTNAAGRRARAVADKFVDVDATFATNTIVASSVASAASPRTADHNTPPCTSLKPVPTTTAADHDPLNPLDSSRHSETAAWVASSIVGHAAVSADADARSPPAPYCVNAAAPTAAADGEQERVSSAADLRNIIRQALPFSGRVALIQAAKLQRSSPEGVEGRSLSRSTSVHSHSFSESLHACMVATKIKVPIQRAASSCRAPSTPTSQRSSRKQYTPGGRSTQSDTQQPRLRNMRTAPSTPAAAAVKASKRARDVAAAAVRSSSSKPTMSKTTVSKASAAAAASTSRPSRPSAATSCGGSRALLTSSSAASHTNANQDDPHSRARRYITGSSATTTDRLSLELTATGNVATNSRPRSTHRRTPNRITSHVHTGNTASPSDASDPTTSQDSRSSHHDPLAPWSPSKPRAWSTGSSGSDSGSGASTSACHLVPYPPASLAAELAAAGGSSSGRGASAGPTNVAGNGRPGRLTATAIKPLPTKSYLAAEAGLDTSRRQTRSESEAAGGKRSLGVTTLFRSLSQSFRAGGSRRSAQEDVNSLTGLKGRLSIGQSTGQEGGLPVQPVSPASPVASKHAAPNVRPWLNDTSSYVDAAGRQEVSKAAAADAVSQKRAVLCVLHCFGGLGCGGVSAAPGKRGLFSCASAPQVKH